jgi:hypothetical protein
MTADPYFLGNAIAEYHIAEWEVHGSNPALLQVTKDPAALHCNNGSKA